MYKIILLCFWLLSVNTTIIAQSVSVQWLKNSDGASWDLISDMKIDTANNIYVVGNYTSTAKKDQKTTEGNKDIFMAKYTSEGEQSWFHQIKSKDYCHINSLDLTNDGQLLISGFFNKEIILDKTKLIAEKGNHAFFAVIDTGGQFRMVKHIRGYFKGLPIFVKQNADKGYWFIGSHTRDLSIGELLIEGNYKSEIFIGHFNKKGELENHLLLKGNGADEVKEVKIAPNGNLWLTGSFEKDIHIGSQQLRSKGYTDAFLVELNSDLEVLELKQIGGIYKDYGKSIHFDKEQNYLWAGCFSAELFLDAENSFQSKGNLDVFIAKYNAQHELLWMDQFGGGANDYLMSMAINEYNSIYLSGSFRGSIEKEEQEIASVDFSSDVFLAKYDKDGRFKYMEALGDTNADYARQLVIDSKNYIYLSGNFNRSFKALEDTTINADGEDYFLTQLYDCEFSKPINLPADTALCAKEYSIIADSGYISYIWNKSPGKMIKSIDSTNRYYLVVKDQYNCISMDSIRVELNDDPIVNLGSDRVIYQGDIIHLVAHPNMESYQWSDNSNLSFLEINTQNLKQGEYHYSVTVTDTNFCKGKGEIKLKILAMDDSLEEAETELSLNIYPNPAKEYCRLQLQNVDQDKDLNIACYTLKGIPLWELAPQVFASNMELELNIRDLAPGTYILIIKNGTVILRGEVVVVK